MMVARPSVHGIIWKQFGDTDDKRYPYSGLTDADGNEKPEILKVFEDLRATIQGD